MAAGVEEDGQVVAAVEFKADSTLQVETVYQPVAQKVEVIDGIFSFFLFDQALLRPGLDRG